MSSSNRFLRRHNSDPASVIGEHGGADAAIVTAATPLAIEQAYRSLKRGGRLVLVGLPAYNQIELPTFETVLNGITVVGSIVGTRRDLAEVFELHAAGRTRVVWEERKLEDVNEAFDDVLYGRVPARVVFRMS
jgi:propanol-preferring alcohol dehydrogenase